MTIDESLSRKTALKLNTEVYHLHRIRFFDNEPIILDINYFSADVVKRFDHRNSTKFCI